MIRHTVVTEYCIVHRLTDMLPYLIQKVITDKILNSRE